MKNVDLWEGCITIDLPSIGIEYEDLRCRVDLPQNQEVWMSNINDCSLSVEFMEINEPEVPTASAISAYWEDLVDLLQAQDAQLLQDDGGTWCYGKMRVKKGRGFNSVYVFMSVTRLDAYESDLLVTWNVPYEFGAGSSSAEANAVAVTEDPQQLLACFEHVKQSVAFHDLDRIFGR